jgi:hypothetical protein
MAITYGIGSVLGHQLPWTEGAQVRLGT